MTLPIPFDKREGFIYHNGEFLNWKEAKIHILTHALHYGSSCFEGVRIYNGKIFKNKEHAERLLFSASELSMNVSIKAEEIEEICLETCKKNNIKNGYIRPVFWRGSEQMQVYAPHSKIHFAVASWGWPNYSEEKKFKGSHLVVAKYKRASPESGPVFAKIGGLYVSSTLVKHDAENLGFDDALMLGYKGFIAETSTSNIFFVFDGELHTPKADCFLNGITRQTVISLAKEMGIKVVEREISLEELSHVSDAFITGTASEVSRVASIATRDLKTKYEFREVKISTYLMQKYNELTK
jgi:branched-chain amino acid aminotransferase